MITKLLKSVLTLAVTLSCFTSCEFDNPYDTEINKPELYINADIFTTESESYIDFGSIVPKNVHQEKIVLENRGAGNLMINSVSLTGSDAFEFVSAPDLDELLIAPGESIELNVAFSASEVADYSGKLTIVSNSASGDYIGTFSINFNASGLVNVYEGYLELTTQAQIDAFNYTSVDGSVEITEASAGNIVNLDGLKTLNLVSGYLYIYDNTQLADIQGLENLGSIGGFFAVQNNPELESISGVEGIVHAPGDFYIGYNHKLLDLAPLANLESVGYEFTVRNNPKITSLDGIEKLASIGEFANASVANKGKETKEKNYLSFAEFKNGPEAKSAEVETDNLIIEQNSSLVDFCALSTVFNANKVIGTFSISGNKYNPTKAQILSEECNLEEQVYTGNIVLSTQAQVDAFAYNKIVGNLTIDGNTNEAIQNLEALELLFEVEGNVVIFSNSDLSSLEGLQGLQSLTGNLTISTNQSLKNFCALTNLFSNNGFSGTYTVSGNGYNPTQQEVTNGDCEFSKIYSGSLNFSTQSQVDSFDYTEVTGNLTVQGAGITNLDGLNSLNKMGGYINLSSLSNVTELSGLSNLKETGGIYIQSLTNLKNLAGLENIETVAGTLQITNNTKLRSLCALADMITNSGHSGSYSVSGNSYNPTKQQIINGDCEQSTVFSGNLTLSTQAQIDDFFYTEVTGNFTLQGAGINNLDGLNSLTKVGGYININGLTNITNLDGLSNVSAVNTYLYIQQNTNLTDIAGLAKITSCQYLYIYDNDKLLNLEGLNALKSITTVNGLRVEHNELLEDISALSSIESINGNFRVVSNPSLRNFCAFTNVFSNGGHNGSYTVSGNRYNPTKQNIINGDCEQSTVYSGSLTLTTQGQIDAFFYTEVTGNLTIQGTGITNLDGLSSLTKTGGYLNINGVSNITNLDGLSNVSEITTYLYLQTNANLTDISGLSKITTSQYVYIYNNDKLVSLDGMNGLQSVTTNNGLRIIENNVLTDISALSNLTSVSGPLMIQNNYALEDFCVLTDVLTNNGVTGAFSVSGNSYNPTKQQVIDGNCSKPKVYSGTLHLSTQAQVDAFVYEEVTGDLVISGSNITNVDGLSSLTKIGGYLYFNRAYELANINGLSNLSEIGTYLYVQQCYKLQNLEGLSKIERLGYLYIEGNPILQSLDGLENLETIYSQQLYIINNNQLSDVSALSNLSTINGNFYVVSNPQLTDFCPFKSLIVNNGVTGTYTVSSNGSNPTKAQVSGLNCGGASGNTITDVNGNTYQTVQIGDQTWMAEDLRATKTKTGAAIANITGDSNWANLGVSNMGYAYYLNNSSEPTGVLYNYAAAAQACPQGWRLPTTSDIDQLNSYITSQSHLPSKALRATTFSSGSDTYGFASKLTNYRGNNGAFLTNPNALYWGEAVNGSNGTYFWVPSNDTNIPYATSISRDYGFCVRCIKE